MPLTSGTAEDVLLDRRHTRDLVFSIGNLLLRKDVHASLPAIEGNESRQDETSRLEWLLRLQSSGPWSIPMLYSLICIAVGYELSCLWISRLKLATSFEWSDMNPSHKFAKFYKFSACWWSWFCIQHSVNQAAATADIVCWPGSWKPIVVDILKGLKLRCTRLGWVDFKHMGSTPVMCWCETIRLLTKRAWSVKELRNC